MTKKRKAAPPAQAGTLGETASKNICQNDTKSSPFRQLIKRIIICAACHGLPIRWAETLLILGGLRHD